MAHYDFQFELIALKALSVERSLCVVCSCSSTFNSPLFGLLFFFFSPFSQLTVFSVCLRAPKTHSQLTLFATILSMFLSLPPAHRPPATLFLHPFYFHEVCIPHLLCRLDTKEQNAPLLTCGKHSSPQGPFTQPESPILPVASARVCFLSSITAWRYHW